jgi:FHA domain-containing protein
VLKIAVVGGKNSPQANVLSATFGASGGSIGRAKTNQLVLEDPERTVSRVHAQIVARDGGFVVVDQGSNPLLHNGSALGAGKEADLKAGDRLHIGSFELSVSLESVPRTAASPALLPDDMTMLSSAHKAAVVSTSAAAQPSDDDPFADLLSGLGGITPSAQPAPVVSASPSSAAMSMGDAFDDPLGLSASNARPAGVDPFDDLLGLGGADMGAGRGSAAKTDDVLSSLPNAQSASIDELFGLGASSNADDLFGDSPLGQPLMQPNTASSVDPLVALQAAPVAPVQARSDHVPALQQAYSAPKVVQPMPPPAPAPKVAAPAFPTASGAFNPMQTSGVSAMKSDSASASSTAAPAPLRATGSSTEEELLAAFLRGAKTTINMPTQLTPQLMEVLGSLIYQSSHGMLQLLMSRQEFKRGFQSEMTMIMTEANNPLKFSPTAEIAVSHLLSPKTRGFMDGEQAMINAYADLRAHQFGVMVGMKAALEHVIAQFEPSKLESKLTEKSKLDAIFSASRKAKLWDQFCQLYSGIASDATEDFHTLFGKAFSKAYDEQMNRFKADQK